MKTQSDYPRYISSSKDPATMTKDDKIIFALDKAIDFILSEYDLAKNETTNIATGIRVMIALHERLRAGRI